MKTVVLDGYTLNPGDLSWSALEALANCEVHDRTPADETVRRALGADALLTNKTILDADVISQLPDLKYIGVLATGYNVVDVEAAAKRGIPVTNVPEYATQSVVQMVFAHILHFYSRVCEHSTSVADGDWCRSRDFCFWNYPLPELQNKTMGIIGLGRIGSAVATTAKAFGMRILAHDPVAQPTVEGVDMGDIEQVFQESDIVSLHCPMTAENREFVNAEVIGKMKSSAFLVNTSRGGLINERALADALNNGAIAGAGLDVLHKEPADPDCPLLAAKNCFITPHIAWATHGARARLMQTAIENLKAFIDGKGMNVVNGVTS